MQDKIKILFVCHGNICRSPMAEFIMKDMIKKAGFVPAQSPEDSYADVYIASAATSSEELGNPVYPPARKILAEHGIDPSEKRARKLTRSDYDEYDLLIGMDFANIRNMKRICGGDSQGKIKLLLDVAGRHDEVADPWYTHNFQTAWDDITEGCTALLQKLFIRKTGAVIAAAGLSARMNAFKPLLKLNSSTIIRCCLQNFTCINCSPVIIITGRESELLTEHISDLPVECVYNPEFAVCDMFTSVKLGLKAAAGRCEKLFITPGDVPLVRKSTLINMMLADGQYIRPVCGNKTGHPVLLDSSLVRKILLYQGEAGLKGALDDIDIHAEDLEINDPGILMDADTPDDYRNLLEYSR